MVANQLAVDSPASERCRVFISYKRDAGLDTSLASFLHEVLESHGHHVFIDVEIPAGSDWSELISTEIRDSDFFIVLLSETSTAPNGFVIAETIMARDSEAAAGHPRILPVRIAYTKALPLRLSAAIGHLQHFEWRDASDNDVLAKTLLQALRKPGGSEAKPTSLLRGDHFVITGSVWQAAGPREALAGTMIVPVTSGQETSLAVTRAKRPGFFGVKVQESGDLEVAIWKGTHYRQVQSQPGQFITMLEGDSHGWCFVKHRPDQPLLLERHGRPQGSDCRHLRSRPRARCLDDHTRARHSS